MISALILVLASQCGPSGCPAPARFMPSYQPAYRQPIVLVEPPAPAHHYEWLGTTYGGVSFRVWGYKDGAKVSWDADLKENRASYWAARNAVVKPAEPPAERPKSQPSQEQLKQAVNYGVDPSKRESGERYTATSAEAQDFVVRAQAAADGKSDRIYLTVIGTPEDRKAIVADWQSNPAFASWHDKVWFQEFSKGDWQVKDELGYEAKGKPTVLVQRPGGGVVLRATQYSGPRPILAALRKADPGYRPSDDPTPDGTDESAVSHRSILAILAVGAVAFFLLPKRTPR